MRKVPRIVAENHTEVPFKEIKQPLQHYAKNDQPEFFVATEVMAEIPMIRDMFDVARKQVPTSFTNDDIDFRIVIRDFGMLGGKSTKAMSDAEFHTEVDAFLSECFPQAYPLLKDYEARVKRQAADIRQDPDSFPRKGSRVSSALKKWTSRQQPDRWMDHFSDLIAQPSAARQ